MASLDNYLIGCKLSKVTAQVGAYIIKLVKCNNIVYMTVHIVLLIVHAITYYSMSDSLLI